MDKMICKLYIYSFFRLRPCDIKKEKLTGIYSNWKIISFFSVDPRWGRVYTGDSVSLFIYLLINSIQYYIGIYIYMGGTCLGRLSRKDLVGTLIKYKYLI